MRHLVAGTRMKMDGRVAEVAQAAHVGRTHVVVGVVSDRLLLVGALRVVEGAAASGGVVVPVRHRTQGHYARDPLPCNGGAQLLLRAGAGPGMEGGSGGHRSRRRLLLVVVRGRMLMVGLLMGVLLRVLVLLLLVVLLLLLLVQ